MTKRINSRKRESQTYELKRIIVQLTSYENYRSFTISKMIDVNSIFKLKLKDVKIKNKKTRKDKVVLRIVRGHLWNSRN